MQSGLPVQPKTVIPLRDHNPTKRKPIVTWALIAINILVFVLQYVFEHDGLSLIDRFGVIPDVLMHGDWSTGRVYSGAQGSWVTPITSMFLHGGVMHLAGNMWFLHVFGDNVEDDLGRMRYLLFYLATGVAAVGMQVAINPSSDVPMVGASGAISGVLAGYLILHPHARVVTLVPIFIFIHFAELPAFLFIFVWFGFQMISAYFALGNLEQGLGGVAWFAHVGGFVGGIIAVKLLAKSSPTRYLQS